jgi:hypothetical protein
MVLLKIIIHTFGPFYNLAAFFYFATELATILVLGIKSADEIF